MPYGISALFAYSDADEATDCERMEMQLFEHRDLNSLF